MGILREGVILVKQEAGRQEEILLKWSGGESENNLRAFALGDIKPESREGLFIRALIEFDEEIRKEVERLKGTIKLVDQAKVEPPEDLLEDLKRIAGSKSKE